MQAYFPYDLPEEEIKKIKGRLFQILQYYPDLVLKWVNKINCNIEIADETSLKKFKKNYQDKFSMNFMEQLAIINNIAIKIPIENWTDEFIFSELKN